jgi:hypothetical protein
MSDVARRVTLRVPVLLAYTRHAGGPASRAGSKRGARDRVLYKKEKFSEIVIYPRAFIAQSSLGSSG